MSAAPFLCFAHCWSVILYHPQDYPALQVTLFFFVDACLFFWPLLSLWEFARVLFGPLFSLQFPANEVILLYYFATLTYFCMNHVQSYFTVFTFRIRLVRHPRGSWARVLKRAHRRLPLLSSPSSFAFARSLSVCVLSVSDSETPWIVTQQLLCPWWSAGKKTRLDCRFLLGFGGSTLLLPSWPLILNIS